jgi:hypothetical protein
VAVLLECGCAACAFRIVDGNKIPCCGIHDCITPSEEMPSLEGREAKCSYGDRIVESNYNLAFFRYKPNKEYDEYYCGCYGWD